MTLARYDELAALAAREHELAVAGRLDELEQVQLRRAELVASLPTYPPAEARPALGRAAELQRETTIALARALREVAEDLGRVGRGRAMARSYAPSPSEAPARTVDRAV